MRRDADHAYDDIIGLPHHQSSMRPHMPVRDRAAQFAPFAALTGYGDAVAETARLTDERIDLDDYEKTALNERLASIRERLDEKPEASITYFCPDARKSGGTYVKATGRVKRFDEYAREVVMADGTGIAIDDIVDVEVQ